MALEPLYVLRICLVILALITFIMSADLLRQIGNLTFYTTVVWNVWIPLFLGILSAIAYSWALKAQKAQKAQKNIIQSNAARYACSLLLCVAWLVSPSYSVNSTLEELRVYGLENMFSEIWGCGIPGTPLCQLRLGVDICGFLMAPLVFLEMILAYRKERSTDAHSAETLPTTVVGSPQPGMTAPYQ
ncbi:MAG: hypothetical protein J3Q66DRAFT_403402 [Benniella sp.]|nr:MAG: hypothetical protein J3Q66DRAFT_403402 [Benniella sp.]